MNTGLRVTVWNEGVHERETPMTAKLYPQGMGRILAAYLREQPGVTNGTFVAKKQVPPEQPCPIEPGVTIRFGLVETVLEIGRGDRR